MSRREGGGRCSHTMGGYDGGQAEYVRVPFIGVDAGKVPDDVEDLDALPLTDACSTGYRAAEMCELKGGVISVIGADGPPGDYVDIGTT
jgi:threonine dehydrogenase-like Zn-dependent dehydrogenase